MANDVATLIDRDEASAALRAYTSRLCAILRDKPDRDAPAIGSWTLGNVANHLTSGIENYAQWMKDADAPDLDAIEDMAAWNIETVQAMPPADLPQLADRIEVATERFVTAAGERPSSSQVRWYAGNRIPVQVALCMRLIEAAIHGFDVATAANNKWDIDVADARTMSYGLGYIAPYFVHPAKLGFTGTLRMHIRGGADLYYLIAAGALTVTTSAPRANWHLSVDPVSWVLVSTGRRSQWGAALRGKIIGWGTSPLLPFKLRAASFQG